MRLDFLDKGSVPCRLDEGDIMDDDQGELANHLFAAATAMIEDMVETAVAGQSSQFTPSQLADHGRCLQASAREVAIIAEAAMIIAKSSVKHPPDRPKHRS